MLSELFIKNYTLIDSLKIRFGPGLNTLTGETGAGKSIIMRAVKLLLGERASSESIRTGAEEALVEGIFQIQSSKLKLIIGGLLDDCGLSFEEEDMLFLCRELSLTGKNLCRINGRLVPLHMYKRLGEHLIDFHGQGQQQVLSKQSSHQELLDNLGGKEVLKQKEQVRVLYGQWKKCQQEIQGLYLDDAEKNKKIDFLQYQYEEIDGAKLSEEEERNLLEEKRRINHREKLSHSLKLVYQQLYGGTEVPSVVDTLGLIQKELEGVLKYDESLNSKIPGIEESLVVLTEIAQEIKEYLEQLQFKAEEIDEIENRLELINSLKRKYGSTISEILEYGSQVKKELDFLLDSERKHQELIKTKNELETDLEQQSKILRELRLKISSRLEKQVSSLLKELEIPQGSFQVSMEKTDNLTSQGFDRIEFLFSANPGEGMKPLSKIASGGEMSRIMLALRTVLAESDEIPSVIFDEIDAGLGGGASIQAVADKLHLISRHRQVICVTHSPQIAGMADRHLGIYKQIEGDRTCTRVEEFSQEERKKEIARMIDGADLTDLTLKHAQKMLRRKR